MANAFNPSTWKAGRSPVSILVFFIFMAVGWPRPLYILLLSYTLNPLFLYLFWVRIWLCILAGLELRALPAPTSLSVGIKCMCYDMGSFPNPFNLGHSSAQIPQWIPVSGLWKTSVLRMLARLYRTCYLSFHSPPSPAYSSPAHCPAPKDTGTLISTLLLLLSLL